LTSLVSFAFVLFAAFSLGAGPGDRFVRHEDGLAPSPARLVLPAVDRAAELDRDAKAGGRSPLRFAVPVELRVSPSSAGVWRAERDGTRRWLLEVVVPEATDLSLAFADAEVGAGWQLTVEGAGGYRVGPFTAADVGRDGSLWTPAVPGSLATVELTVQAGTHPAPGLDLVRVNAGYRDLLGRGEKQGTCNLDVECSEGDPWQDQAASVGLVAVDGHLLCSGALVADVSRSFLPYVVTAAHCGVTTETAASVVVYWGFESPACGQLGGGSLASSQAGAALRMTRPDVDVALLELDDEPSETVGAFWSGWDRSGGAVTGAVAIHHPAGGEKALAVASGSLSTVDSCIGSGGVGTHWQVAAWDDGTTEPGSDGGGLWSTASGLLVGVLSGGEASCDNPTGADCFGKLSAAWDGPAADARLRDWLDPGATGATTLAGSFHLPWVRYVAAQGVDACATDPGNDNGVWEPGETITLAVSVRGDTAFTGVTGVLTSSTPQVTVVDGSASWPDLVAGVETPSSAPHFTVSLRPELACFSEVAFELTVTANEGGPFTWPFSHQVGAPLEPVAPLAIPDGGTVASTLAVGDAVTLCDLDVEVEVEHSFVGDLEVRLESPLGTEVVLLDRPGVPATGLGCGNDDLAVTFDDEAGTVLEDRCEGTMPWFAEAGLPVEALAAFDGESTAGTWTLRVSDASALDTGSLLAWRLETTPATSAGTCTVCTWPPLFVDGFETGDTSAWSATQAKGPRTPTVGDPLGREQ
jgi:subtilisin-like proprotein convertase family protein